MIVAIPACEEADRIEGCIAALATQHDAHGSPLMPDAFEVVVVVNNSRDGTADILRGLQHVVPIALHVVEEDLCPEQANAGWARKRAMDRAATMLTEAGRFDGVVLTTDADSRAGSTWIDRTRSAFAEGVDAVAGYIEAEPTELIRLGPDFVRRGRLEDTYLSAMAEIYALCDPRPHDLWPNHRVASGASFAVTLKAYRTIGGLPPQPVGEDAALARALECSGFTIRHAMDVCVTTSCRFDGRALGGAADTMRHRHANPDALCDADMEPAMFVLRRALWRGRLRRWHADMMPHWLRPWPERLGLTRGIVSQMAQDYASFESLWQAIETQSPRLARHAALRPSDLPAQIIRAHSAIRRLRNAATAGRSLRIASLQAAAGKRLDRFVSEAVPGGIPPSDPSSAHDLDEVQL